MSSLLSTLTVAAGLAVAVSACTAGAEEAPVASTPLAGTLAGQTFAPASAFTRDSAEGGVEIYLFPNDQITCTSIDSAQASTDRWVHVITPGPLVVGESWNVDLQERLCVSNYFWLGTLIQFNSTEL
jgi:hypothetical protein